MAMILDPKSGLESDRACMSNNYRLHLKNVLRRTHMMFC